MTARITRPFVERQLENLNRLTGMPLSPYHKNEQGVIIPKLVTTTLTTHTAATNLSAWIQRLVLPEPQTLATWAIVLCLLLASIFACLRKAIGLQ